MFLTVHLYQDPKTQKLAKDVSQRFKPLLDKLAVNDCSPGVVQNLSHLCQGDISTLQFELFQQLQVETQEQLTIFTRPLLQIIGKSLAVV
jgi:hypothetical protein